jgi:hypothetical protein
MLLSMVECCRGLPVSSATGPRNEEEFVLSSHAMVTRLTCIGSYIRTYISCCARGAELLLPNAPSPQCHHLTLLTAHRPATKHVCWNYLYRRPLGDHDS